MDVAQCSVATARSCRPVRASDRVYMVRAVGEGVEEGVGVGDGVLVAEHVGAEEALLVPPPAAERGEGESAAVRVR